VGASEVQAQRLFAADVRARVESRLGFRVAGKLVQRHVELGQAVRAGQLLAQLDARDYRLAVQAAQAQVAAATTQRDLAQADYERFAQLKAQNFISGAELDRRRASLQAAQAQLTQALAQASSQGNQENYTQLRADADGVVTAIEAEPGQVLEQGQTVLRLAQDGARDAVFAVPEDLVSQLRVGQEVAVRPWGGGAEGAAKLRATVRDIAASADPVTRTFTVKAALSGSPLPPLGATLTVYPSAFAPSGVQALRLPTSALWAQGQQTAVWVFDAASSTVRAQVIEVAQVDGNEVLVRAGLQAGAQVVATGVHVLAPGQKVSIYQAKTAPEAAKQAQAAPNLGASSAAAPQQ
jgi:RND family efflux transporter MFP subunit